jgi:hypothetical protein
VDRIEIVRFLSNQTWHNNYDYTYDYVDGSIDGSKNANLLCPTYQHRRRSGGS